MLVVAGDDPADFCLPVVVVDEHFQLVADPLISGNVASLTGH